ncbi:ATP-binding protein [Haemophilus sputorum]|uniref:ATP-binding protein n=1 Tax=Haemophilus sputorum TaxID=1078480 RepID=A0A369YC87_9PAST|nr:ATP-binding protein [Haemophilus sputorum]RDE71934.1 ATP-binding protein [Haemophilus sputorum]
MLLRASFENFMNFEGKFTLDLSNINKKHSFNKECVENEVISKALIYGKSGRGKSNLGKVFLDLKRTLSNNDDRFENNTNYLNANSSLEDAKFSFEFKFENTQVIYSYNKKDAATLTYEKLEIDHEVEFEFDFREKKLIQARSILENLELDSIDSSYSILKHYYNSTSPGNRNSNVVSLFDFIRKIYVFSPSPNELGIDNLKHSKERIINYILEHDHINEFNSFLNDILDLDIPVVQKELPTKEKNLYFRFKNGNLLDFSSNASSGSRCLLNLFAIYKWTESSISFLYIDEFDASYHYQASMKIIDKFKRISGIQCVFTTHNTDLMNNEFLRPDCYFIIGENQIKSLPYLTKRDLQEGHNLEKLYQAGEFD